MYKLSVAIVVFFMAMPCWSKTAICTIELWDYASDTKYIVEQLFDYPAGIGVEHKRFKLPGSSYTCALGFYNLETGTNLVCFFDDTENAFAKSDRTGIKENSAKNNLIFRLSDGNYGLKSSCK